MENLLKDCVITQHMNAVAAGTSTQTSAAALDMAGYEGCIFIASLGTVTDTSALALTVLGVATNVVSGGVAVTGAAASFTALTSSNTMLVVDVIRPATRYLYVTLARATANAVINCIIAIRYRARNKPVTLDATVLASALAGPIA